MKLSLSEQRKRAFQQKIVAAATQLFCEKGIVDTSITDIIKTSGIAHKTFFNHFPSKNHLLFHIANLYSGYADKIFEKNIASSAEPKDKLSNSFSEIAEMLCLLEPAQAKMFKEILNGIQLGLENSKTQQQHRLDSAIQRIMEEADAKEHIKSEMATTTYSEMISGLFIATMLSWSQQQNLQLKPKMQRTIEFIQKSIFL
jgi:AcrR family transcriptional regulator